MPQGDVRHTMLARACRGAALLLLASGALAGCSTEDELAASAAGSSPAGREAAAEPAPDLQPLWSIPGLNANPGRTGPHHWMTYQSGFDGIGRGTTPRNGPMLLVDARTGSTSSRKGDGDRWPCATPSVISPGGVTPVAWVAYEILPGPGNSNPTEPCQRVAAFDASTGKVLWRRTFDPDALSAPLAIGADDDVVVLADRRGRSLCWAVDGADPRDPEESSCRTLRDRVTGADLPPLTAAGGAEVVLSPFVDADQGGAEEIGRTDEILLLRDRTDDGTALVRAHDLATGRTLWQDVTLEEDPFVVNSWARTETYFVAPSGVVHVTYEHPASSDDVADTPMVLTAVDPRTGTDLREVARIPGAWFNHQFDDVTVALTEQDRSFSSTISGFELPTW